jgi:hypothetical protein
MKSLKKFGQVIKYETFIIKSFDQLKKHNFDQLNFGQVIISRVRLVNLAILSIANLSKLFA